MSVRRLPEALLQLGWPFRGGAGQQEPTCSRLGSRDWGHPSQYDRAHSRLEEGSREGAQRGNASCCNSSSPLHPRKHFKHALQPGNSTSRTLRLIQAHLAYWPQDEVQIGKLYSILCRRPVARPPRVALLHQSTEALWQWGWRPGHNDARGCHHQVSLRWVGK